MKLTQTVNLSIFSMIEPMGNNLIINLKDKEYEFHLYSFEEQKELIANDILAGQSINNVEVRLSL